MSSPVCKVCHKPVTPGKVCGLCQMPVCHDHRTKVGGSFSGKSYFCKPPCSGRGWQQGQEGGGPQQPPYPTPYRQPQAQQPYQQPHQQQQQQQHWQQMPTTYHQPAAHQSAGSFWTDEGGSSPNPPGQPQGQPQPERSPYLRAQPPSPSPSNGSSFASPPTPTGPSPAPSASPASNPALDPAMAQRFGLGCGLALPSAPNPDTMNMITVPGADGAPIEVFDDPDAIVRLTGPHCADRRLKKNDTVEFTLADGPGGSDGAVRRGVIVGARPGAQGQLVILERRRASHGASEVATILPQERMWSIRFQPLGKCRHCGCLIPLDEARLHVDAVHKTSASASTRVDAAAGVCVGNVDLLLALQPSRQLGAGAQGTVHMCPAPPNVPVDEEVRMAYYVRKDMTCRSEEESIARYQQAVRLMSLKHAHVIRYLAVQRAPTNDMVRVVMPYYPEDDLSKTIARAERRIDEEWVCSVVLQLATALAYLHSYSPPILHGDLKPENVMLFNKKNQVILMDFDTSVELGRDGSAATATSGTMEWMAPEAVAGSRCTANSDVWSLGLLAYVLAALPEFPMLSNARGDGLLLNSAEWDAQDLNQRIAAELGRRQYSHGFVQLVQAMMARDPRQRPSAQQSVERITALMEARLLGMA